MELKERIAALLKYTSLTASAFARRIDVKTTQAVYDLLGGKTRTLSADIFNKITSCYPEISIEWLVTGDGEMLRPAQVVGDNNSGTVIGGDANGNENSFNSDGTSFAAQAFAAINEQCKLVARSQEHINRLLTIIEKMQQ